MRRASKSFAIRKSTSSVARQVKSDAARELIPARSESEVVWEVYFFQSVEQDEIVFMWRITKS